MKSSYEVTVVGGQLPGLLAGALLAKRGLRVLVVRHDAVTPDYAMGAYRLPRAPFALLDAASNHTRQVLQELALLTTVGGHRDSSAPSFQMAVPGHRFDVYANPDLFAPELTREFRSQASILLAAEERLRTIDGALRTLLDGDQLGTGDGFFARRAFARALERSDIERLAGQDPRHEIPTGHPYAVTLAATHRSLTGQDPEQATVTEVAHLHGAWRAGPLRTFVGAQELEHALTECLIAHGGAVITDSRVERVTVAGGRARSLRLSSQEEVGTDFVVLATDVAAAQRLFADRRPFDELLEASGDPHPRYFRYTVNVVVRPEGVPDALAGHVFFVRDPAKPLVGENSLRIDAHQTLGDGSRLLTVEALISRRGIEDVPGYLMGLRDRVVNSLGELIPFLGRHTVLIDSPHDGRDGQRLDDPHSLQSADPWSRGPKSMTAVYRYPRTSFLGLRALPTHTPLANVFLANAQNFPGLGGEGAFVSASLAAKEVVRRGGQSRRPKRASWLGSTT